MSVINRNSGSAIFDTFTIALTKNMRVGQVCIVNGQVTSSDGLGAQYEVKANGSGGVQMSNGNELVILDGETLKPESVENIAGLTGTKDNSQISLKGYHPDSDVGGGTLYWSSGIHNGVTRFDPARAWPNWAVPAEVTAWFLNTGLTVPVWERTDIANLTFYSCGARASGDNIGAWIAACNYLSVSQGAITIPYIEGYWEISNSALLTGGTLKFESNALIKNTANDAVNFWANTCLFIGSYFGFNKSFGVNGETSYDVDAVTSGNLINLTTAGDAANFSVGDIVYIADANNYGATDFAISSHISEIEAINSGELRLRDPINLPITANGGANPTIRKTTDSLAVDQTLIDQGAPVTAVLAKNVKIINGQFETNDNFNQCIHVSCHESELDFDYIKGGELLGVNPCSYSSITLRNGQYTDRSLELAYYHQDVSLPFFKARRFALPTPLTTDTLGFSISEYGNGVYGGVLNISDEDWAQDQDTATIGFLTPLNFIETISVNGSQTTGVTFGSGGERAEGSMIDKIHIVSTEKNGVVFNSDSVTVNQIVVDNIDDTSGYAVDIKTGVGYCYAGAVITKNTGPQYRVRDINTQTTNNINTVNAIHKQALISDKLFTSHNGVGADSTLESYTATAGTVGQFTKWDIRVTGNITNPSTTGAKDIRLDFNGTTIAQISVGAGDVGFFELQSIISMGQGLSQEDWTGISRFINTQAEAYLSSSRADNAGVTDLVFSLIANLSVGDVVNIREFSVIPSFDNRVI